MLIGMICWSVCWMGQFFPTMTRSYRRRALLLVVQGGKKIFRNSSNLWKNSRGCSQGREANQNGYRKLWGFCWTFHQQSFAVRSRPESLCWGSCRISIGHDSKPSSLPGRKSANVRKELAWALPETWDGIGVTCKKIAENAGWPSEDGAKTYHQFYWIRNGRKNRRCLHSRARSIKAFEPGARPLQSGIPARSSGNIWQTTFHCESRTCSSTC